VTRCEPQPLSTLEHARVAQRRPATRAARNRALVQRLDLYLPYIVWVPVLGMAEMFIAIRTPLGATMLFGLWVIGYLAWGLFEYVVHRFILHAREDGNSGLPGNRIHMDHHGQPDAHGRLNVQLSESVPTALAVFTVFLLVTWDLSLAVHLQVGFMSGYLFYEYLDFQAHHGLARGVVVRFFRRYHLEHHHADAKAHYGVTSPIFDLLFGTFRVHRERSRPSRTPLDSLPSTGEFPCA
jgi:sterol desaturase/sphingolipid hydroxylase (fatty acid hydroxylase superfamily)